MEKAIAAVFIYSLFLVVTVVSLRLSIVDNLTQTVDMKALQDVQSQRIDTRISIESAADPVVFRCETRLDLTLKNVGDETIRNLSDSDLLIWYTATGGTTTIKRLAYTTGNLDQNEWSFVSTTETANAPTYWEPDDEANLTSRLDPKSVTTTQAYITVATSNGVSDSRYFSFANAVAAGCYFLHNTSTPPTGDTASQALLPLDTELPAAATLYNYDTDRDSAAGLLLQKTPLGLAETDPAKFQTYRTGVLASPLVLNDVLVDVWAGMLNFDTGKVGAVTVFLRDRDPSDSSHIELGNGTVFARDWQEGSGTFVERMAYVPDVDVSIPAGHELEVWIVIDNISGDTMMLAYDTVSFPSLITPAYVPPAADTVIYIHNSSTPPTGDTNSQTLLMMSTTTPTTTISLPNYDQDRDADDGLLLNKTDLGLSESDATKFQEWRASSTSTMALEGDIIVEIWAAIKDYGDGKRGVLTVFLRDRNPSGPSFTEIGNATVYDADWQEGALDFIKTTLIIPGVNYTVPSGNQLVARLVVDNNSEDAMWIAYDTAAYKSVIKLALGPPPSEAGTIAADDFESGDLGGGTGWLDATWITAGTVAVTSANTPQQGTFHMQVDRAAQADRTTDMTGQTSPRLQFWGRVRWSNGR